MNAPSKSFTISQMESPEPECASLYPHCLSDPGGQSHRKLPNLAHMLNFLSRNWGQTLKFLKPQSKTIFREWGAVSEATAPLFCRESPLSKLHDFLPNGGLFGTETLDFQAKKCLIHPEAFLSINFRSERPPIHLKYTIRKHWIRNADP